MAKKKIYRAGIIPYHIQDGKVHFMFMKPSDPKYGGSKFQIAKGKVEDDEDHRDAATREGGEELGLYKGNIEDIHAVGQFLGRMSIYIAKIKDKTMFGDPHFETSATIWMTMDEFDKDGRDLQRPIVRAAQRLVDKKENV